ncbi:MAG: hypothetical protein PSY12_01445 [bacterium]|nr:hypothetical protein [bacterium]
MSEAEADLFRAFVERSQGYFEYGIGGSTFYASSVVKGPVRAVDSDMVWIASAQASIGASPYERKLIHVDIGPTKEWGQPVSMDAKDRFPDYYRAIIDNADQIDLCLVDGRFRVACFLQALLTLPEDAIIGIHDYRGRTNYHSVETFGRPIAEREDMTFFVRRSDASHKDIQAALQQFAYNYA